MPVPRKTLLLGWEAADLALLHPLLDAGRLPHLRALMETGATGGLGTLAPLVTETLWTSVATGCLPPAHGVLATLRPAADGLAAQGFARRDWGRRAVWDVLATDHGWRTHVLGWPAMHPAIPPAGEGTAGGGVFASERHFLTADAPPGPDASWPAPADGVFPTAWAEDLTELRVHPGELGAAQWRDFLPGIMDDDDSARAALSADPRVARLAHHVAETAGLAFAAGHVLENAPWDFAAVRFGLLEDVCRDFGADHGGPGPFGAVVGAAHVLLDTVLGNLLTLAGPDANVLLLSTHGYLAANGRSPGPGWDGPARHRPRGFAVLRGPGVRPDSLFDGGHLLGAAPTLLAMNDLPIGADLPGRVWSQAFEKPPAVRVVPSLERPTPTPRAAPPWTRENDGSAPGSPAELAGRELRYGLAVAHLATGQPAAARPWLERARREDPTRLGPAIHLVATLHALGRFAESRALLETLAADPPISFSGQRPQFDLMRGVLDLAEGRPAEALVHLRRARRTGGLPGPEMHRQLGEVYLALRRWREAAGAFARALRFDPDDAVSHLGRAVALYRQRRFPRAGEHARRAATLAPELARAHLVFGLCLARAGKGERAILALRHAVARQPGFGLAHRVLARLLARSPETAAAAELHRQMGRRRK